MWATETNTTSGGLRCILQPAKWEFDVFGRFLMREKAGKADEV